MTTTAQEKFDALASRWQEQTGLHSNTAIIMRHPAIQAIIAMGEPAVPLMLRHWRDHGGQWQHALTAVTGVVITEGITPYLDRPALVRPRRLQATSGMAVRAKRRRQHDGRREVRRPTGT